MKPQEFLKENEFIGDDAHQMHQSHQHHMLREECYHSAANAIKLHQLLGQLPEGHELDAWAAEKISLANDYLKTVTEWLEYDVMGGTNEAMMAGGMQAFSMESAERQYAELLGESDAERAYVCVHANKGQCEVTAKTSYEAARKAAAKWKLKNTAGVDAHLKDVKHQAVNEDHDEESINQQIAKIFARYANALSKLAGQDGYSKDDIIDLQQTAKAFYHSMELGLKEWRLLHDLIQNPPTTEVMDDLGINLRQEYNTLAGQVNKKQGVAEGEITKTAAGTKHRSTAAYGGTEKDTDHLRTLDKAGTNRIDKAIGVKFKKQGRGLDLGETTSAGSVATAPAVGGGTLFGGDYQNPANPFRKKSAKKESMIKR